MQHTGGIALLSVTITPESDTDRERLAGGLTTLMAEDPTIHAKTDPATGEVVLGGMAELHLAVIVDRLRREFQVEAHVSHPRVFYKEIPRVAAEGAAETTAPALLEPVMRVEVTAPSEYASDVIGTLTRGRGQIQSREARAGMHVVAARVPLSEMLGYAADLRARTRGRGTFAMQFAYYQPLRPSENPGTDGAMVAAPHNPSPPLRDASVALPEPIEDDRGE